MKQKKNTPNPSRASRQGSRLSEILKALSLFSLIALTSQLQATVHGPVDSVTAFNDVLPSVQPGDVIVWEDGTYSNKSIKLEGVDGTADAPITLRAETPGGVTFTGTSKLYIAADYAVVTGFTFEVDSSDTANLQSQVIQFREGSDHAHHSRLTNVRVVDTDTGISKTDTSKWVSLYGRFNRVDHCSFEGKRSKDNLMTVWFYDINSTGGSWHRIENNYFADRPQGIADSNGSINGWEIIRIGDSSSTTIDAHCYVTGNYFYECDGEVEIVSNKSDYNSYFGNTFRDSEGQLALRQGNNCWIEGNYFLGDGSTSTDEGGVRVYGENQVVINNYFESLSGDSHLSAIALGAGNASPAGDEYIPVKDSIIAHNTIYDCENPFGISTGYGGSKNGKTTNISPSDTLVANNVVEANVDNRYILDYDDSSATSITYLGNILYHTYGDLITGSSLTFSSSEISTADPLFSSTASSNVHIYRPVTGSPTENAAATHTDLSDLVIYDIFGLNRPSTNRDVGCDERWGYSGSATNFRLTASDVGVSWGSNANTAPDDLPEDLTYTTVTLTPADDAYVRDGSEADETYGTLNADDLYTKATSSSNSGYNRRVYVKFDLSSIPGEIVDAQFRLKVRQVSSGPSVNYLWLVADDSWDESTITWNNRPGIIFPLGDLSVADTDDWVVWDVTIVTAEEEILDDTITFSLLPSSATTNAFGKFYSKEYSSANAPQLVVTYAQ